MQTFTHNKIHNFQQEFLTYLVVVPAQKSVVCEIHSSDFTMSLLDFMYFLIMLPYKT